ncbi:tetratricopeptide repeat protein [Chryseobacterium taeanense]|uniref:tetratricopeptide repeat protein n=1 Tax=Chryseobacterium taeanense TaxID=311334 RepID=UPI0035AFB710
MNRNINKFIPICNNKYLNYTCLILIVTSILITIYCLNTQSGAEYSRTLSSLILLQFLSFFAGSFLGFLFGFPSHNNNQFLEKYQRNSSLKEITSWLTKIIVGITLIEFKDIFHYLKYIIHHLSNSLSNDDSHTVIIAAIIGTYFILGFIVFFILSVTTIFEELVVNDKNIESILTSEAMNPNELHVDNVDKVLDSDFANMSQKDKQEILKYVATNGLDKLNYLMTKRLAKFLYVMEEYDSAAKAYEIAYNKNNDEKYCLLNACYISNKFLKDFDNSNKKLKDLIKVAPKFAPARYNLACNYYREYLEFGDNPKTEYMEELKTKAEDHLIEAFKLDKGLYSYAKQDEVLHGIDLEEIFRKSKE